MSDSEEKTRKPRIGISIGDVNGIGPEVIIKSLQDSRILNRFTPIIYASGRIFSFYKKRLKNEHFSYYQTQDIRQINSGKVNVINVWQDVFDITPGVSSETGGRYAVKSLKAAVSDLKEGKIDALTTAPINKENVQSDKFDFPGHTEYLAKEAGSKDSLMFLVHESLRVGVVTGHVPLSTVIAKINKEFVTSRVNAMIHSLQNDFGITKPKVAVLGLNPHSGENGLLGKEEKDYINPAINDLKSSHKLVYGSFPADGFFGMKQYRTFDGILAMYHDQGLIPFKTLAFGEGVNFTANLPFIRTSPDHGTAYGIAGKNEANETSFRNALYLASDISKRRAKN